MEQFYTTEEAATQAGTARVTAQKWATQNDVFFIGEGKRKTFKWTDADIARFNQRNTNRGRPRRQD
jgi:hypothetical protein